MSHSPWWRRPSPEQEDGEPSNESKSSAPKSSAPSRSRSQPARDTSPAAERERGGPGESRERNRRRRSGRSQRGAGRREDEQRDAGKPDQEPARAAERERKAPPPKAAAGGETATVVLCDVESVANALRDAELENEDAPAAIESASGPAAVRRVYALGNRFSRLRRVLEDAGFERVPVDGSPISLRMQLAVDAIALGHRHPGGRFLIAAQGDEMQPVVDKLASEGHVVDLFDEDSLGGFSQADRDAARALRPPREEDSRFDDDDEDEVEDVEDEDDGDAADEPRARPPVHDRRRASAPRDLDDSSSTADTDDESEDDDEDDLPTSRESAGGLRRDREDGRSRPAARSRGDAGDPFELLLEAIERIVQGPPRLVFESVIRQEILEIEPRFNERSAGFGSFTEFFEEAQEKGLIEIRREPATGTYLVVGARLPSDS